MHQQADEAKKKTTRVLKILLFLGVLGVVAITLPFFLFLIFRPGTLGEVLCLQDCRALAKSVEGRYTEFLALENRNAFESLDIRVFETKAKLKEYVRQQTGLDSISGPFHPSGTDILLVPARERDRPYEVHEIVRFLNFKYFGPMDPWLDDGFATWFEMNRKELGGSDAAERAFSRSVGEASPSWDDGSVRGTIELRAESSLSTLPRDGTQQRLIAFALVDMLICRDPSGFASRMKTYLGSRKDPDDSKLSAPTLFKRAFGLPVFEAAGAIRGRKPAIGRTSKAEKRD